MPHFGEYETVEQISISEEPRHVTTVWKALKSGPPDGRVYAIKCYAPRPGRITTGQPEEALQQDRALSFLEGIKQLKKAHQEGAGVVPLHAFGLAPEGAWYVTDYYQRGTLKEYIDRKGSVDSETLRHVVYSVVAACQALQRSRGRSHGNLKPSNVLLAGNPRPLRKTALHLTDPHPAPLQLISLGADEGQTVPESLDKTLELQDLRTLGELILQLVEGRLLRNSYEYNYPVARSNKWDSLGKGAESWRELCNRLLDPNLSLEQESLDKLAGAFRPKSVKEKLPLIAGAAAAILAVMVGAYLLRPKAPIPPPILKLTVTAANKNRPYGSPNPPLTGKVDGLQPSDGINVSYSTTADTNSAVGTYAIVPVFDDPNRRLSKYSVTTNEGTLTITAAPLAVTAHNQRRAYGTANPPLTGTVEGLRKGDDIIATYTTKAETGSPMGNYEIVPVLTDPAHKLNNYRVTTNRGTLTIVTVTRIPLTVTASNQTRAYGTPNPRLTGSITPNNDNITATFETTASLTSPVGDYAIVPVFSDPAHKLSGYDVITNKGTLAIAPSVLEISASNQTRAYGIPNPPLTGWVEGLRKGDNITVTYNTKADGNSAAGTYDIVPEVSDPDKKQVNYAVVLNKGTLAITPSVLQVSASNQTRAYGTPNPPLTGRVEGLRKGDNITVTYNTKADGKSAAGTYDIVPELRDPDKKLVNYAVLLNKGTLTVMPAEPAPKEAPPPPSKTARGYDPTRLRYLERASQLIGKPVRSNDSKKIGELEDVALDLSAGRALGALLSSGAKATPVPAESFTEASINKSARGVAITLDVDKTKFADAPPFPPAKWGRRIDAASLAEAFHYFGRDWPGAAANPAGCSSGTNIIGTPLTDQAGIPLGEVEDLMIDLPEGKVVFLVIKPDVSVDPDSQSYLYVLPPATVQFGANDRSLVLQASRDLFVHGVSNRFEKTFWVAVAHEDLAARVYQYYGYAAGGSNVVAGTSPPAQGGTETRGSGASDKQIITAFLVEIVNEGLPMPSRDEFKATVENGRLTLRGRVKNEKLKEAFGKAAERVAGAGKVDNQLVTRSGK
jgi:sporulation protein YlmC with PRC-barrel domain/serine/threonine protein kinase